jgi:hypothetical protein
MQPNPGLEGDGATTAIEWFFDPVVGHRRRRHQLATGAAILLLYLGGFYMWFGLLSYKNFSFRVGDWSYEHRFYLVLKEAVTRGVLPFYTSYPYHGNHHFLAFVNIPASPQIILLKFLSIQDYLVFNTVFFYSLSVHGCWLIAKKYRLSLAAFTWVFLLVNFNGHITSHLAIGHTQWFAYFLFPYALLLMLDIRRDCFAWRTALVLSGILFFMLLQGGVHIYVITMTFLFLLVVTNLNRSNLVRFGQVAGLSAVMASCRLLPGLFFFGDTPRLFVPGYATLRQIADELVILHPNPQGMGTDYAPAQWAGATVELLPWEYDLYVGVSAFAFLAICGLLWRFRSPLPSRFQFKNLDWPMAIMTWMALGPNYYFVIASGIPVLSSVERAPARFVIVPLLILIVVGATRLQTVLDNGWHAITVRLLAVVGVAHTGFALYLHFMNWRVETMEHSYESVPMELFATMEAGDNAAYESVVKGSILVSILAVILWSWLYYAALQRKAHGATVD